MKDFTIIINKICDDNYVIYSINFTIQLSILKHIDCIKLDDSVKLWKIQIGEMGRIISYHIKEK